MIQIIMVNPGGVHRIANNSGQRKKLRKKGFKSWFFISPWEADNGRP